MHLLTFFDGVALTCGGFCVALAFAYWREYRNWGTAGYQCLWIAMALGAYTWTASVFLGSLEVGGTPNDLAAAVPGFVSLILLLFGYSQSKKHLNSVWDREWLLVMAIFAVGIAAKLMGGPRISLALATAAVFIFYGINAISKYRKELGKGYWLIAVAFFSHPVFYIPLRFYASGISVANLTQFLAIPFTLIGGSIFAVDFANSRAKSFKYSNQLEEVRGTLRGMLYSDAITGIPSRLAQNELLRVLIDSSASFSTLGVSLKNISQINSNFGTAIGDAVIVRVVSAIQEVIPAGCKLGRSSGSRFSIIAIDMQGNEAVTGIAMDIIKRMDIPIEIEGIKFYLDVAIGAAVFPLHGSNFDELVRNTYVAVHAAELHSGTHFSIFDPSMDTKNQQLHWLDVNLHLAIEQKQFELHYQPKVYLANGGMSSVEALVRWTHPERGNIRPDEFIGRCEANGLIVPLGMWIIESAARQAALWYEQGNATRIAINISGMQLQDSELLQRLGAAQEIANGMLDIELTESALIRNEDQMLELIQQCRMLGFGVHLDDFGTGYSSLSRLMVLPLTVIKLDRSFVMEIGKTGKGQALLKSMVGMANELEMSVVAEGVETQAQADFLKDLGVSMAQGWLYAPAMPPEKLTAWCIDLQTQKNTD